MITKLINAAGPPLCDHHEDLPLHCFYVFQGTSFIIRVILLIVLGYLHLHFIYLSFYRVNSGDEADSGEETVLSDKAPMNRSNQVKYVINCMSLSVLLQVPYSENFFFGCLARCLLRVDDDDLYAPSSKQV